MNTLEPCFIAIVGGSGSGKSWLAEKLCQTLKGTVTRLCQDNFYLDRSHLKPGQRARVNFDNPRAIDWKSLETVLTNLKNGKPAKIPSYDFASHCRARAGEVAQPADYVIAEGLWLLRNRRIKNFWDFSIYLDCPDDLRLKRRIDRDVKERGRKPADVCTQFERHVTPMHSRFVAPQARLADVIFPKVLSEKETLELARLISQIKGDAKRYARN